MQKPLRFTLLLGIVFASLLTSCRSSIPPVSQFLSPAVGTLVPGQREEAIAPTLSQNESGVLMVNQTGAQVQIVVSSTIATIPAGSSFLFVLPPDTYQFYIYEPGQTPWAHNESALGGKLRYVYLPLRGVPGLSQ
jgi:hypothetical protein